MKTIKSISVEKLEFFKMFAAASSEYHGSNGDANQSSRENADRFSDYKIQHLIYELTTLFSRLSYHDKSDRELEVIKMYWEQVRDKNKTYLREDVAMTLKDMHKCFSELFFHIWEHYKQDLVINFMVKLDLCKQLSQKKAVFESLGVDEKEYVIKQVVESCRSTELQNTVKLISRFDGRDLNENGYQLDKPAVRFDSDKERFLKKAHQVITENLSDSSFSIEQFTREMGVCRTLLHLRLKAYTGLSASAYIRHLRLDHASKLIQANFGSISEIAYETGFNDHSYFAKSFKKLFGMTPSAYAANFAEHE